VDIEFFAWVCSVILPNLVPTRYT